MQQTNDTPKPPPRKLKHRYAFDAMMMFLYTSVVYVWGLRVYPLGRDYAAMAAPDGLPFLANRLFAWETATFGARPIPYHLVNLVLLYACMLCIYHLTRFVMKGPAWFGTLAATMFMATPAHSEAVLNLSGVADLLPCLAALVALALYTAPRNGGALRRYGLEGAALLAFALAVLPYRENVGLILVLILFELLAASKETRRIVRLAPFGAVAVAGAVLHRGVFVAANLEPGQMFGPLYFLLYPIGLLPETAARFHTSPWLGWLSAATVLVVVALIYRKARRPILLFGLLGTLAVRLCQGGAPIDPVHMVGGGQLLLANALFNVALAALFWRMMEHPKWRQPVILITTLLCVVLFGLQVRSNRAWQQAGEQVQAWQARAAQLAAADPGHPVYLTPDYQFYRGAPMCLSDALAHDTPFSQTVQTFSMFPLHYPPPGARIACDHWLFGGAFFRFENVRPIDVVCWPYTFTQQDATSVARDAILKIHEVRKDAFILSSRPKQGKLPLRKPATVPELP